MVRTAQLNRIPRRELQRVYEFALQGIAAAKGNVDKETLRCIEKIKQTFQLKDAAACYFCKRFVDAADNYCSGCRHTSCSDCSKNDGLMGLHSVEEHLVDSNA